MPIALLHYPAPPELAMREHPVTGRGDIERLFQPSLRGVPVEGWIRSDGVRFLARYVRWLGCTHVIYESHYVDRDYRAGFGALYSQSLLQYANNCTRIHFFGPSAQGDQSTTLADFVEQRSRMLAAADSDESSAVWKAANLKLSDGYLGYTVMRPLPHSPIGRTVLRCRVNSGGKGVVRMHVGRSHVSHVGGFDLTVKGTMYAEQDRGTSACATTALWSALHAVADPRDVPYTLSDITRAATAFSLTNGRGMPSPALTVGEMSEAIRAIGYSPYLFTNEDHETALALAYLSVESPLPAIMILRNLANDVLHAVTLLGGVVAPLREELTVARAGTETLSATSRARDSTGADDGADTESVPRIYSRATDLRMLVTHNDELGPYTIARIVSHEERETVIEECLTALKELDADQSVPRPRARRLPGEDGDAGSSSDALDYWASRRKEIADTETIVTVTDDGSGYTNYYALQNLVYPLYPDINITLADVLKDTEEIFARARSEMGRAPLSLWFEFRVALGTEYVRRLMWDRLLTEPQAEVACTQLALSRYVIVLRLGIGENALVDVVMDSTGVGIKGHALAVVPLHDHRSATIIAESVSVAVPEALFIGRGLLERQDHGGQRA